MTKEGWIKRRERYGIHGSKNIEQTKSKRSGKAPWNKGKEGEYNINFSASSIEKFRKNMSNVGKTNKGRFDEKSSGWKGNKIGYFGLHMWIRRKLGAPHTCQFCKTTEGKIEWANKSWKYKRDLDDWIPLCTPCHRGYDSNNKKKRSI